MISPEITKLLFDERIASLRKIVDAMDATNAELAYRQLMQVARAVSRKFCAPSVVDGIIDLNLQNTHTIDPALNVYDKDGRRTRGTIVLDSR